MEVVKQICDSVAILNQGKIVEQGRVLDLVAKPQSILANEFFPRRNHYAPKAGATLATVAFAEGANSRAIFTTLAHRFNVDIDILSGSVETVSGHRVGQFHLELEGQGVSSALQYLHELNFAVEVH
jgi:D-methionine transport system ATP-binding protein